MLNAVQDRALAARLERDRQERVQTERKTMRDMRVERHLKPRPPLPSRSEEYIDILGHLNVPLDSSLDEAPHRGGWEPRWVSVNLSDPVQKVVKYRRVSDDSEAS